MLGSIACQFAFHVHWVCRTEVDSGLDGAFAATKASEETAGGSLTNPEKGVVSEFLVPAEYSPLR
jgi:hypothetical protein